MIVCRMVEIESGDVEDLASFPEEPGIFSAPCGYLRISTALGSVLRRDLHDRAAFQSSLIGK